MQLRRITSKIFPAFYAQMSSLFLSPSSSLMWPVLISGADIAAVPSPLVEKTPFPLRRMLLSTRTDTIFTQAQTRTHTWAPLNSERKRRLIENGSFWGGEWKDQVSVKSTKPRATLRAVRCQQLLFTLSLCITHTETHTQITMDDHNWLWQSKQSYWL